MRQEPNPPVISVLGQAGTPQASLRFGDITVPAVVGRNGILPENTPPAEGDGATPQGQFALRQVYYRPDRISRPMTALPVMPISPSLLWCDDPESGLYNRPVHAPFLPHHESMWLASRSYDLCVVLDFNLNPAVPGLGSAVFFHITRQDENPPPTEGCVAITPNAMRALLAITELGTMMRVGIND